MIFFFGKIFFDRLKSSKNWIGKTEKNREFKFQVDFVFFDRERLSKKKGFLTFFFLLVREHRKQ